MFFNSELALPIVKQQLGLQTDLRDSYLSAIIKGVITEFEDTKGIILDEQNSQHLMLIVDFAAWRYKHPADADGMPRHLQYRLRELYLQAHIGG
ncbi:hypothetical protein E2R51_02330 [Jeotgalibacillus sp. S-D1]|uniref:hypothetical protein n=1 Tax=Jeotgalibacillus sp. S-D1 TaxID=2552189 RepID=UPI00105926DA|nr:hypothetical protein [Jeotgalibacillus sp. S-D1]TDL34574.1 hypothetical protein E2R51_02330 [Jeotgalibacillus sp. S-D1]